MTRNDMLQHLQEAVCFAADTYTDSAKQNMLINPSAKQLHQHVHRHGEVRGLRSDNQEYWWPAYLATHAHMSKQLGLGLDYHTAHLALEEESEGDEPFRHLAIDFSDPESSVVKNLARDYGYHLHP